MYFSPSATLVAESLTHTRYFMVDVVVNNVMATSINPDYSVYMFKNQVRDPWLLFPFLLC